MSDDVSNLEVEQLALGELDEARAALVREKLERAGDDRLEKIEASNREILQDYPPEQMAARIRRRAEVAAEESEPASTPWRWIWIPTAAAVAAAALVLVLSPGGDGAPVLQPSLDGGIAQLDRPPIEHTRLKGDARLTVVRQDGGGAEPLRTDDEVSAGDLLQISYVSAGAAHGTIVSIDGAGAVTLHYPSGATGSTELSDRGPTALDHSYELDDAPGFERFFLVTSDEPIDVGAVMDAAQRAADAEDPRTIELEVEPKQLVRSLVLRKAP
jgi:hypothetical protein